MFFALIRRIQLPVWVCPASLAGHRVVPGFAKGVTAKNSPHCQHKPFRRAMGLDGLQRIVATGGAKPAITPQKGGNKPLIASNK